MAKKSTKCIVWETMNFGPGTYPYPGTETRPGLNLPTQVMERILDTTRTVILLTGQQVFGISLLATKEKKRARLIGVLPN